MHRHPGPSTTKSKLPEMKCSHVARDESCQIAILAKAGYDRGNVARVMNRHKSSLDQEVSRNRGERGNRPKHVHEFSPGTMRACENGPRSAPETAAMVDARLCGTCNPEQVSVYFNVSGHATVSHESIDQRTHTDKRVGGSLDRALRDQKVRRQPCDGRERRGAMPDQVPIALHPAIGAEPGRFGDNKADLVIGVGHNWTLVTMTEPASDYSRIAHVAFRTTQSLSGTMVSWPTPDTATGEGRWPGARTGLRAAPVVRRTQTRARRYQARITQANRSEPLVSAQHRRWRRPPPLSTRIGRSSERRDGRRAATPRDVGRQRQRPRRGRGAECGRGILAKHCRAKLGRLPARRSHRHRRREHGVTAHWLADRSRHSALRLASIP